MIKTLLLLKRKWLPAYSVLLICFCSLFSFSNVAYAIDAYKEFNAWLAQGNHPVLTLGLGGYITGNAGNSVNFPIQVPITDSFYNYTTSTESQRAAVISIFLGKEWLIADRDWFMQGGLEFNETSGLHVNGNLVQGAEVCSENFYTYNYSIIIRQLLIDAKILYTYQQIYHPYITGGLGASFNRAYSYTTNVPPDLTFTQQYRSNTSPSFTYALGFGVDIDIHENLRLGIGYRFTNLGQVSLGSANIDHISVQGTLRQGHLYASELIAQFTMVL
jgi:opacity protein-like surface antigen